MKISLIVSCFLAALFASSATAAEHLRQRNLQGGSGSFNFRLCFSENAKVQVHGKGSVAMKHLAVGDKVLAPDGRYEPVYAFAHWDNATETNFLSITTNTGKEPLEISDSHMIYVQGKAHPVRSDTLAVGTVLQTTSAAAAAEHHQSSSAAVITSIEIVKRTGLYAPLTPSGTLMVNGIKASSYVSIQEGSTSEFWLLQDGISSGLSNQDLFHLFLSPFRMMCMGIMMSPDDHLCQSYDETPNGIPYYAKYSLAFADWFQTLPLLMQSIVLLAILVVFGSFQVLEAVAGPTYAPLLVLTLALMYAMNHAFQMTMRSSSSISSRASNKHPLHLKSSNKSVNQRFVSTW